MYASYFIPLRQKREGEKEKWRKREKMKEVQFFINSWRRHVISEYKYEYAWIWSRSCR